MEYPDKIHVEVTEDDIAHGQQRECADCPIARAVARVLPKADGRAVSVDGATARVRAVNPANGSPDSLSCFAAYPLPSEACSFVSAFDRGDIVSPIAFDCERSAEVAG